MTQSPERPLELSESDMRRLVGLALDRIVAHVTSLPEQPSAGVWGDGHERARAARSPLPEQASDAEEVLDTLFRDWVPVSFNTAGPGYLAYIPGGGIFHAALADLIADTTNRYVGVWQAAPVLAELEADVLRWFAGIVGYPAQARGILTSGGSLANFSAIVTARRTMLPERFLDGTLYTSDQAHHSVAKAAVLAGFPPRNVRSIPSDGEFRIRVDVLEESIDADRRAGLHPFLIVASAGTTNTGAVDDHLALADVAARRKMWLHSDAAYGGFFLMTERGRWAMRGIERADSVALDPHKGLFLPYGTGSLLVREGERLRRAHALEAEYLPPMQDASEFVDFCDHSPELSRPFRGLRVWLAFKLAGARAFREQLEEKLDLARWAADQLRALPDVEVVAEPQLSLLAFRVVRPGLSEADTNALNRKALDAVNRRGRVYITGTTVAGRYLMRICVLSFRTHMERMEQGLEDIRQVIENDGR